MDSSLTKALARQAVELERYASGRPQTIRRLPALHDQPAESALELRFRGVENLIQAMDRLIGRSRRKPRRR